MSLTSLWKSQNEDLKSKRVQAIVAFAGDGKLLDGSKASKEFREFLTHIPSEMLAAYAEECVLQEKFSESGAALQDVINEIGRRLGFLVENGLYRGKVNEIGNDGLWKIGDAFSIILEVKTTDAYTINLDTLANYRMKLASEKKINLAESSILIVVGRSDTYSLEAQVRGSRHAWDIRLISIDALLQLMRVKEDLEDPQVVGKIRQVLTPKEFTKVDEIINLVFSTTTEVRQGEEIQDNIETNIETSESPSRKSSPVDFREACLSRLQHEFGTVFVKRSSALYSTADQKIGIICLNSREHEHPQSTNYWFGFRRAQKEAIEVFAKGYVAFGCGSPEKIILIPIKSFLGWLDLLNVTEQGNTFYWHVHITERCGHFVLKTKEGNPKDLDSYFLPLKRG